MTKVVHPVLQRRLRSERRFYMLGLFSVGLALALLVVLLVFIGQRSLPAFSEITLGLDVTFDRAIIDPDNSDDQAVIVRADYLTLARRGLQKALGVKVSTRQEKRRLYALISRGAGPILRREVLADPSLIGQTKRLWLPVASDVEDVLKGSVDSTLAAERRRLDDQQLAWIAQLQDDGRIERGFNRTLWIAGASSYPELAGVGAAAIGSLMMMLIVLLLSLPLGVGSAIYLEKFAPKGMITRLIEVNINNLAAVPSIIFGIFGLAIFINFADLPRSAPIVGGLVLTLMTLPVVIVAARVAIRAVPPSIEEAALAIGATHMQAVFSHILPLAFPGIITGTIIGLARALGETAPLLMIGMVAFVTDVPTTINDPATALPVQIFMWAGAAERAFVARTSAAIVILLIFLMLMNATAIYLRQKYERRY